MNKGILAWLLSCTLLVVPLWSAAEGENESKFGDTRFIGYEGAQNWPVSNSSQIIKEFAVPIYIGLPTKRYRVLGRIVGTQNSGLGVMTRAFAEGLWSEKDRQRDCANQAKFQGGDAVIVTNNEQVLQTFGLSPQQLEDSSPLFDHKRKITLAIQFF
jgi:hypothetical protein